MDVCGLPVLLPEGLRFPAIFPFRLLSEDDGAPVRRVFVRFLNMVLYLIYVVPL